MKIQLVRNLINEFPKEEEKKKYANCRFIEASENGIYQISDSFNKMIRNRMFSEMVKELIDFGIARYFDNYADSYKDTNFQLYQKYKYEDVCRLLNWKRNMNAQNISGYFYDVDTKTLPVLLIMKKLTMRIDIEHDLKVALLKDLENNASEDGYSIVDSFLKANPYCLWRISQMILK